MSEMVQDSKNSPMICANLCAVSIIVLSAGFLCLGIDLMRGVSAQHVAGYPSFAQMALTIYLPAACLTIVALAAAVFNFVWRRAWPLHVMNLLVLSGLGYLTYLYFLEFYYAAAA